MAKLNGGKLARLQNVTSENVRLVRGASLTDIELYDLSKDVGESTNVADEDPERTAKLKAMLEQQYRELVKGSHVW